MGLENPSNRAIRADPTSPDLRQFPEMAYGLFSVRHVKAEFIKRGVYIRSQFIDWHIDKPHYDEAPLQRICLAAPSVYKKSDTIDSVQLDAP